MSTPEDEITAYLADRPDAAAVFTDGLSGDALVRTLLESGSWELVTTEEVGGKRVRTLQRKDLP